MINVSGLMSGYGPPPLSISVKMPNVRPKPIAPPVSVWPMTNGEQMTAEKSVGCAISLLYPSRSCVAACDGGGVGWTRRVGLWCVGVSSGGGLAASSREPMNDTVRTRGGGATCASSSVSRASARRRSFHASSAARLSSCALRMRWM